MGRSEFAHELEHDGDLGVDLGSEALIFACQGMAVDAAAPEITSGVAPGDLDPLHTHALNLSSRPGATKKMYLNFLGGTVSGTAWNCAYTNCQPFTVIPYDVDGVATTAFSTTELSNIVAIWRAVAEDYAPFDIDVTTIPPSSFGPTTVNVMIGGSSSIFGISAGGIAYVNVFGRSYFQYYQPALVFPAQLGTGYPKYVWEAVSHEVGHNMGLSHDGQVAHDGLAAVGYYTGQANYAPIMGVGYYEELTQWSKGEYQYANQLQDDVAIIADKTGWAPSYNGNSFATATPLDVTVSGASSTGKGAGIVNSPNAADYFSFDAAAGTVTLTATVVKESGWPRSNLDTSLTVYNSEFAAIASINPSGVDTASGLGVSAAPVTLPAAGRYYVSVSGASLDVPSTGYSNYGSLGQFAITATYPTLVASASPSPAGPSPSPAVPSPSPAPENSPSPPPPVASPSPSPPTGPTQIVPTVTSVIYNAGSKKCSATVFIKTTDGAAVSGVTVQLTGRFEAPALSGAFKAVSSTATSTVTGSVGITSGRMTSGNRSCRFLLDAVNAGANYVLAGSVTLPVIGST